MEIALTDKQLKAARNAAATCLTATPEDKAIIIFDDSAKIVAAALMGAFDELEVSVSLFNIDLFDTRPLSRLPGLLLKAVSSSTVSTFAARSMRGELSMRKDLLDNIDKGGLRHAHMPSVTTEVFEDSMSMDYRNIAEFIEKLAGILASDETITLTSVAGTNVEFKHAETPFYEKLDGLIKNGRWQNLPSGQLLLYPMTANGVYVVDRNIGDWFEHRYNVAEYPITMEFEKGLVRSVLCENKKLERDLRLFLRSSDNSSRISELVVGANLALTNDHSSSLYDGYRPGVSLAVGSLKPNPISNWSAATFLPLVGKRNNLYLGDRQLMMDDSFAGDILDFDWLK